MGESATYTKNGHAQPQTAMKQDEFFSLSPPTFYEKDRIFAFPGEIINRVIYIVSGTVRVYDISQSGNEVVVNVFKPKSLFPMAKVLNHTYNHYFYQATSQVETREVTVAAFRNFLESNPETTLDLLAESFLTAQVMRRRMAHLMGGSATNRLLYELVFQAERYGSHRADGSYLLSISEGEIGARAGLSRETVSRELRKFKASGLVTISSRGILLQDVQKLEALLGSFL
jgi:CRP-like cAMP-binding protein